MMQDDSSAGKGFIIFRHSHRQFVAEIERTGAGAGDRSDIGGRILGSEVGGLIVARNFLDRKGLGVYAVSSLDSAAGEPSGIGGNVHLSNCRRILWKRGGDSDRVAEEIGSIGGGVGADHDIRPVGQSSRGQDAQQQNQDQQQTADPKCSTFHVSFLLKFPWWPPGGSAGGRAAKTYAPYLSGTPPPRGSVSFFHHTMPFHERQQNYRRIQQRLRFSRPKYLQILQKRNNFRLSDGLLLSCQHHHTPQLYTKCIQAASSH